MPRPTQRLINRIERDFTPDNAREVVGWLDGLGPEVFGRQDPERIQASLVLAASGDLERFVACVELLRLDWRDALVAGGLADANWPERLDAELSGQGRS